MMNNKLEPSAVPTVQQWIAAFTSRLQAIGDSCRDLYRMVEANPMVFDELIAADRRFTFNMLESMRRVGAGEMYVDLLFDSSAAARRLLPLPRPVQEKLYNDLLPAVKHVGDKFVVENRALKSLSSSELSQVIDYDRRRARTVEEQIAHIKSLPAPEGKVARRYTLSEDGSVVHILAQTDFTIKDLLEVVEEMKRRALATLEPAVKKNQVKK
jgi:hypothetical protein